MSIRTNESLPGYSPESFKEFIRVVTKEWNLSQTYIDQSESYFLKHLTASEIADILTCDGIEVNGITYIALFNKKGIDAYNEELVGIKEIEETGLYHVEVAAPRKFWLSFRAVKYPLGTSEPINSGKAGNLKAYVLIQLDTSNKSTN